MAMDMESGEMHITDSKEMAETNHFWARKYLIYTLFTPFDLSSYSLLKERVYEMIKILFICWGKRFQ